MSEQIGRIVISAIVVVIISVMCYYLDKKHQFSTKNYWLWQFCMGILFGGLVLVCLWLAPVVNGFSDSIQNIVPLCAGLVFGAPAALLSAIVGATISYFNPQSAWDFVRTTTIISLLTSGLFAGFLRYYMFDNKIASWVYGPGLGVFVAAFHMLALLLSHMNRLYNAYSFVKSFHLLLVIIGSMAITITLVLVALLGKEREKTAKQGIAQSFEQKLLICVLVGFLATCSYSWLVQTKLSENETYNLLRLNLMDLSADIIETSDDNIIRLATLVASQINDTYYVNNYPTQGFYNRNLEKAVKDFDVSEIDLIDKNGIIVASNIPKFVGFDMAGGNQSAAFLPLLQGTKFMVQKYQPISFDKEISRKYAGVSLPGGGFLQIGYGAEQFQKALARDVAGFTRHQHVGETGGSIICDKNGVIVSDNIGQEGNKLKNLGLKLDFNTEEPYKIYEDTLIGEPCLCMFTSVEGYNIVTFLPQQEVMFSRNIGGYITAYMEIVLFVVIFLMIYFLVKKLVVDNIHKINTSLAQIASGNLDVKVEVRSNEEFESLSDDINTTVDKLKDYIAEAAARIDRELEFARTIQTSALPKVFPPWPYIKDFSIYATMDTAKEVGGDFYDFFLVGDKLGFVLADVSGKGIPAALFMMKSKTEIKNRMEQGGDLAQAFNRINVALCENNDANMFVTVFAGVLDYKTGELQFVNAGHNKPLFLHKGNYNWLEGRSGLPLASFESAKYKAFTLQLQKDDILFTYTDGVTEATNAQQNFYSDHRLVTLMNTLTGEKDVQELLKAVKKDVDLFAGGRSQADDITMLAVRWNGPEKK